MLKVKPINILCFIRIALRPVGTMPKYYCTVCGLPVTYTNIFSRKMAIPVRARDGHGRAASDEDHTLSTYAICGCCGPFVVVCPDIINNVWNENTLLYSVYFIKHTHTHTLIYTCKYINIMCASSRKKFFL